MTPLMCCFQRLFLKSGQKNFLEITQELTPETELVIATEFWLPQKKDTAVVKIWKFLKRRQYGFKTFHLKFTNKFRTAFKRPIKSSSPVTRKFPLIPFLDYFIRIPAADFMFRTWLPFLQKGAKVLYEIHITSEEIKNLSLFVNESEKSCASPDPEILSATVNQMQEKMTKLQSLLKQEFVNNEVDNLLEDFLQEKSRLLVSEWEKAGTFALPVYAFGPGRIKASHTAFDKTC